MSIQSILFNKNIWSLDEALKWLVYHNYKTHFGNKQVDITDNYYRFRQEEPDKSKKYRIKKINDTGIEYVMEYENEGKGFSNKKIPYGDAKKISQDLIKENNKRGVNLISVGSVARGSKLISDIDFITISQLPNNRKYDRYKLKHEDINVDIWLVKPENVMLAYFIRTYPRHYIIAIRKGLKNNGYKLTDQELFNENKNHKKIRVTDFKKVAKLAGIEYHPLSYYSEI